MGKKNYKSDNSANNNHYELNINAKFSQEILAFEIE